MDPLTATAVLSLGAALGAQMNQPERTVPRHWVPDQIEGDVSGPTLWDLFEIEPIVNELWEEMPLEWPVTRPEWAAKLIGPAGRNVVPWGATDDVVEQLDAMHQAFLGRLPPVNLEVSAYKGPAASSMDLVVRRGSAEVAIGIQSTDVFSYIEKDLGIDPEGELGEQIWDELAKEFSTHSYDYIPMYDSEHELYSTSFRDLMRQIHNLFIGRTRQTIARWDATVRAQGVDPWVG